MGAEQKKVILSWIFAIIFMVAVSMRDTLAVLWAAFNHPSVARTSSAFTEPALTEFRRMEQRYFLDHGIYIPLEDIMFADQIEQMGQRYSVALSQSCSGLKSKDAFAIWLPLKIHIPFLGERVSEWCWKPTLQS